MAFDKKYNKGSWQKKESKPTYKEKRGKLATLMTEDYVSVMDYGL